MLVPPAVAAAQDDAAWEDAVLTAAQYVLDQEQAWFRTLNPGQIVVDVNSGFGYEIEGGPIHTATRSAAARLASSIGARPGRLSDVMECPGRAPTVEEYAGGYWGCRLVGNTEVVIQVDDPVAVEDGLSVWIGLWDQVRDPEGRPRNVAVAGREVLLSRGDDGRWAVTGWGLHTAGHY